MSCSKIPEGGSGPGPSTPAGGDLRPCAFCLKALSPEMVKTCTGCRRRVYCSKGCQERDWKRPGGPAIVKDEDGERSGVAQGHKRWCRLPFGEEGLEWIIKEKPDNGTGKKTGVFALRDIPPLFRIMVEGFKKVEVPGAGGGFNFANLRRQNGPVEERESVRIQEADHSCAANAGLAVDKDMKVTILYSARRIRAGEEITIQFQLYNNIFVPLLKPNKFAANLYRTCKVVCPDNCVCKDKGVRAKLLEIQRLREPLCVENIDRLIQLGEEVMLPRDFMMQLHDSAATLLLSKRNTMARGFPHTMEVKEFVESIYHPKSSCQNIKISKGDLGSHVVLAMAMPLL